MARTARECLHVRPQTNTDGRDPDAADLFPFLDVPLTGTLLTHHLFSDRNYYYYHARPKQ